MSELIGILTCEYHPNLISDDQSLIDAFDKKGIKAEPIIWSDQQDLTKFTHVILRSPWDYAKRWNEFEKWLEKANKETTLIHSHEILRWNADKRYLQEIGNKTVRKIPTLSFKNFSETDFHQTFNDFHCDEIVFKPLVGASGVNTFRVSRTEVEQIKPILNTKVLAQPFMSSITEVGEYSFIYFGNEFSHAVLKSAKDGEFRIQEEHGGRVQKYLPKNNELEKINIFLKTLPYQFLYCRVDVAIESGELYLMELEVIEPELFFRFSENGEDKLVEAYQKMFTRHQS